MSPVRGICVGFGVREDGIFQLIHHGIVEAKRSGVRFRRQIQTIGVGFLPGFEFRGKVRNYIAMPSGVSRRVKTLDDDGLFLIGEPEEALHGSIFGRHPNLFGSHGAEMTFQRPANHEKSVMRGMMGQGCRGFLRARNGQRRPS